MPEKPDSALRPSTSRGWLGWLPLYFLGGIVLAWALAWIAGVSK